jgi:hypothetical protein
MGTSKMSFFRKKKEPFNMDALNAEINFRMRGLFLDSQLKDAFALSVIAGTSFVSDEVGEREQQESDKRVERIAHLAPLIFAHTYQLAKSSIELQRTKLGAAGDELPEEVWDNFQEATQHIAIASVVGSLSQMVDLKLLSVGPRRPR